MHNLSQEGVTAAAQRDRMKAMGEHDVKIDLTKLEETP
jgi:hypothetical protein